MTATETGVPIRALAAEELARFHRDGYLHAQQIVPPAFLRRVRAALEARVEDRIREWQREGLLVDPPAERSFGRRYLRAWRAAGRPPCGAYNPTEPSTVDVLGPLTSEGWLTQLAADLLGVPTVTVLDSSRCRAKFPFDDRSTLPWHQDAQCVGPISGLDFVTVWIPLVDVSERNSCLEVSPTRGSREIYERVWSDRISYVCMRDEDVQGLSDPQSIRMRRGDALLLGPYVPHRTWDNVTTSTRWSIDIRFASA